MSELTSVALRRPIGVWLYFGSFRAMQKLMSLAGVLFTGFWLARLSDRRRHAIDKAYYDGEGIYQTPDYNEKGLWPWEQQVIEAHFDRSTPILLGSAGGGREVVGLRRLGYDVDAFECHPALVDFANAMLGRLALDTSVRLAARDECPDFGRRHGAGIVGWGGYMLIRSRQRRVRFLRQLAAQLEPGAPLLLSFFSLNGDEFLRFQRVARVANAFRPVLGGERIEVGDYLVPNFVHYFRRDELAEEAGEAGFELIYWNTQPYGHAVVRLRD